MLFKPEYPVLAKVRIGEKRETSNGGSRPASVDYFLSDDPTFKKLTGDKPHSLRIQFPFASQEDNFSTGMEWWVKGKSQKNVLACYTKDGEKALRMSQMTAPGEVLEALGPPLDTGRLPIVCKFRECPIMKRGDCKPMGRLIFWLEGGPKDSVYELDTKSWNSIEALTAAFIAIGDPRGRTFELSVSFNTKGANRFPVLSLTEADVKVNTPAEVELADAVVALSGVIARGEAEAALREPFAHLLDLMRPGWRDDPAYVARIKEVGVTEAAKLTLGRFA